MTSGEPISVRAAAPDALGLPPAHLELTWRGLGPADAAALHAVILAVEEADRSPARTSRDEVDELFGFPWVDPETDFLGGFDRAGRLRAYGLVQVRPGDERTVRAFVDGGVDPAWRGRGVGRAVLQWMEGRARQMLAASGKDLPARIAVYVDEDARDQRRLYAAAGFSPIRWYTQMRRDLAQPLPDVVLPEGVRVVPWSDALDEQVRVAHNEAFADHWGSEPRAREDWSHGTHFVPSWSFVALARTPDGEEEVAGYTLSSRYTQDFDVVGYTFGYTDLLGVRQAWRGHGVAVALLTAAMRAFADDGMAYANLGVDTANPSGAHGLYARLGYERTHGEVLYSVEL